MLAGIGDCAFEPQRVLPDLGVIAPELCSSSLRGRISSSVVSSSSWRISIESVTLPRFGQGHPVHTREVADHLLGLEALVGDDVGHVILRRTCAARYSLTSSRRSESKSMSMSGRPLRSGFRKRSNSSP